MNLHEYQAKALFREYDIPVPHGVVATTPAEARAAAAELTGDGWVVKAQIHAGARGKAGGIVPCATLDAVAEAAERLLGSRLATAQTDAHGLPVKRVLIEPATAIAEEYYLSCLVDRNRAAVVCSGSRAGGVDIEAVARETPEKIVSTVIQAGLGVMPYQSRAFAHALGLPAALLPQLTCVMRGMYQLLKDKDAMQVEINPLVRTQTGELLALDAKLNLDDNALFLHPDIEALRDPEQEAASEREARAHGLSYVALGGSIGCMVNGAGLAMATMDVVRLHGGAPANFLDVGGGTTAERVAEAFKLIVADRDVRAVLVNIFGGIVRCDLIAEGIIQAVREVGVQLPVVVRLEGTRADAGKALLQSSGLALIAADDLDDAARKAVEVAR